MATNTDTSSYQDYLKGSNNGAQQAYNQRSAADILRQKSALQQAQALKKPTDPTAPSAGASMSPGVAGAASGAYGSGYDMSQYGQGQPMPAVGVGTGGQ